jgi:hypothetical protein
MEAPSMSTRAVETDFVLGKWGGFPKKPGPMQMYRRGCQQMENDRARASTKTNITIVVMVEFNHTALLISHVADIVDGRPGERLFVDRETCKNVPVRLVCGRWVPVQLGYGCDEPVDAAKGFSPLSHSTCSYLFLPCLPCPPAAYCSSLQLDSSIVVAHCRPACR